MGNFNNDLDFGKIGEEIIYKWLLNHKNTKQILDVRNDLFFQDLDIDFIQESKDNQIYKIEVKTDRMADRTKNIIYEYYSNKTYQTKGCFEKTKSDFIFYYLININVLYILNTNKLRNYVYKKIDKLEIKNMGDNALGYIIPLRLVDKYKLGKRIEITKM